MNSASAFDFWYDNESLNEIRKIISPTPLTDVAFKYIVELGRAARLNPFLDEICAVQHDNEPAKIFIRAEGYRKMIQRHPDYEYHRVDAVYSCDNFSIVDDKIQHAYELSNRGNLVGAYCKVKRRSSNDYTYVMVPMEEEGSPQGLWKTQPEIMIKDAAESKCLRLALQDLLGCTYGQDQYPGIDTSGTGKKPHIQGKTQTERLKKLLQINALNASPDYITGSNDILASPEQIDKITALMIAKNFNKERISKALSCHNVIAFKQLTDAQARLLLLQLATT